MKHSHHCEVGNTAEPNLTWPAGTVASCVEDHQTIAFAYPAPELSSLEACGSIILMVPSNEHSTLAKGSVLGRDRDLLTNFGISTGTC